VSHHVELLWFADCPNHPEARRLVADTIKRLAPTATFAEIDASDPEVAAVHRFPGSPTIRIDGIDIEPGFADPGDYAPRCRLYWTTAGLRGIPDPAWIEEALRG
jgi:hypothetical protein